MDQTTHADKKYTNKGSVAMVISLVLVVVIVIALIIMLKREAIWAMAAKLRNYMEIKI